MNNRELITAVIGLAATSGASIIVTNAIKTTTPMNLGTVNKVLVGVGSIALSGLVSQHAAKFATDQADFLFETVDKFKAGMANG